jgi:hypothetical protein
MRRRSSSVKAPRVAAFKSWSTPITFPRETSGTTSMLWVSK